MRSCISWSILAYSTSLLTVHGKTSILNIFESNWCFGVRTLTDLNMSTPRNTNNTNIIQGDEPNIVTMDMLKGMLEQ